ncbi:hypothetical protein Tco_0920816, partial [Tanacetum coccineum]
FLKALIPLDCPIKLNGSLQPIKDDSQPTVKGVGLRVADSHTSNHPEDGFTPLETIRMLLVVIGRRSHSGFKLEAFEPERRYPELLLGVNKDKKSFKDKVPLHPEIDPLYDQITIYPCIVQTFPDPILYLAGLKTTWKHSPRRPVIYHRGQGASEGRNSPSSKSVNNDAPLIDVTPLSFVYPSNIIENVDDSDDPSYGEDGQTLVGLSLPPHPKASKKLKMLGKRKVASSVPRKALPPKVQKVPARASKVAAEASTPLDVDSDFDIHEFPLAKELRDAIDCHWVVAHAVLDNLDKDRAYAELERRCNEALQDLDKNPLVSDIRADIKALQGKVDGLHSIESERERLKSSEIQLLQKIDSLKHDRAAVVSKVILEAAMKLIHSDDLGVLIAKHVRSFIIYSRCQAFKEVVAMEEPFALEKMSGYRSSSKEEYDQAGDALANASYPFLRANASLGVISEGLIYGSSSPFERLCFREFSELDHPQKRIEKQSQKRQYPSYGNQKSVKRQRKRISEKRMKNEAKNDKTEHGMEKREKTKSNQSQSQQKSTKRKTTRKSRAVMLSLGTKKELMAKMGFDEALTQQKHCLSSLTKETQEKMKT